MTPNTLWTLTALIVSALMTGACANMRPASPVAPPRLILPEAAARPCALATLPPAPTLGDLETAYVQRGAQLAACDAARRLAVDTLIAERAAVDRWLGSSEDGLFDP